MTITEYYKLITYYLPVNFVIFLFYLLLESLRIENEKIQT